MPSYLPTSIQQIGQLPTSDAALLSQAYNGPKVNTDDILKLLDATLGRVNRSKQEERYASAIDAATRALQAGMSYNDAVAGLPSDITGSKEFREAILGQVTEDIRKNSDENRLWSDSLQNQEKSKADIRHIDALDAQIANALRKEQMQEEALGKFAQIQHIAQEVGSSDASWIFDRFSNDLKNNPILYTQVMDWVSKGGKTLDTSPAGKIALSLPIPGNPTNKINADHLSSKTIEKARNWVTQGQLTNQIQLGGLNPALVRYIKGEYTGKTIDEIAEKYTTNSGEKGSKGPFKDFNDARENIQTAYNSLRPVFEKLGLPKDLIWAYMDQHMTSPSTPWTQIDFDLDAIVDDVKPLSGNFEDTINSYKNIILSQQMYSDMGNSLLEFTKEYQTSMRKYNNSLRTGKITRKEYEQLVNTLQRKFNNIMDIARYKK